MKKLQIYLTLILVLASFIAQSQKKQMVKSDLPEGKTWKLVWNDEFNESELDTTKWGFRLNIMQTRHKTWTDDAYELDGNGYLLMKAYEKDGDYHTSQLQTGSNYMDKPGEQYGKTALTWPIAKLDPPKFLHKFGYYEIRCKLPTQEGWWVAFWLQSPTIGSTLDPIDSGVEIDIMENFARDNKITHNIHWNGYSQDHKTEGTKPIKVKPSDDGFHTFGVDWSPLGYVFYTDGKETWRISGPVSHREQFILISAECAGYREGAPAAAIKKAILPDYFIVDYVRVFDGVEN